MVMPVAVASIWNCINYPVVCRAVYATIVSMIPQDVTVTIVERVITGTIPSRLIIVKSVNVSKTTKKTKQTFALLSDGSNLQKNQSTLTPIQNGENITTFLKYQNYNDGGVNVSRKTMAKHHQANNYPSKQWKRG